MIGTLWLVICTLQNFSTMNVLKNDAFKGWVDPKMIISHEHICTIRNKVASLKNCRNSFICEREAFYSLIFRLFASQSSDCCLPVSGLSQSADQTERDKPVMGTLSLVNQYCQPMRVVPSQSLSLSVNSADWEQ